MLFPPFEEPAVVDLSVGGADLSHIGPGPGLMGGPVLTGGPRIWDAFQICYKIFFGRGAPDVFRPRSENS